MEQGYSQKAEILGQASIIDAWKAATGDAGNYDNLKKGDYLTANLFDGQGASAKLEFHPDFLNNRHRVVIEDFSAYEQDDPSYLDALQLVSHALSGLRSAGVDFSLEGPQGYSDGQKIKADVQALLVDTKNVETKNGEQMVA